MINEKIIEKEIYSTDEIKTNKIWIDGKQIYRKVIKFNNLPASGDVQIIADLSELNIDNIFIDTTKTFGYNGRTFFPIPKTHLSNVISQIDIRYNSSTGILQFGVGTGAPVTSGVITIEYTKK